jgi:hypothetical protein
MSLEQPRRSKPPENSAKRFADIVNTNGIEGNGEAHSEKQHPQEKRPEQTSSGEGGDPPIIIPPIEKVTPSPEEPEGRFNLRQFYGVEPSSTAEKEQVTLELDTSILISFSTFNDYRSTYHHPEKTRSEIEFKEPLTKDSYLSITTIQEKNTTGSQEEGIFVAVMSRAEIDKEVVTYTPTEEHFYYKDENGYYRRSDIITHEEHPLHGSISSRKRLEIRRQEDQTQTEMEEGFGMTDPYVSRNEMEYVLGYLETAKPKGVSFGELDAMRSQRKQGEPISREEGIETEKLFSTIVDNWLRKEDMDPSDPRGTERTIAVVSRYGKMNITVGKLLFGEKTLPYIIIAATEVVPSSALPKEIPPEMTESSERTTTIAYTSTNTLKSSREITYVANLKTGETKKISSDTSAPYEFSIEDERTVNDLNKFLINPSMYIEY